VEWVIYTSVLIVAVGVVAVWVLFLRAGPPPAPAGGGRRFDVERELRSHMERLNAENQQMQQELATANRMARQLELRSQELQRKNQIMEGDFEAVAQREQELIEAREKLEAVEASQRQKEQRNLEALKAEARREQGDLAQLSARCDEYLARLGDLGPIVATYSSLRQTAGLDGLRVLSVALQDMAERLSKPVPNAQLHQEIGEVRDLLRQSGDYRLWVLPMHMLDFCEKLLRDATDGDRKHRELLTQGVIQDIRDMYQRR
jgi:DNA repair exonuclease SbcCD ATPase subunit